MNATDLDLQRRAFALCIVTEPHRDADEDLPCSGCLLHATRQLAIPSAHLSASASMGVTGSAAGAPIDGAAGRAPSLPPRRASGPSLTPLGQASGSTFQTDNRPGDQTRAVYRPNVLGQKQV